MPYIIFVRRFNIVFLEQFSLQYLRLSILSMQNIKPVFSVDKLGIGLTLSANLAAELICDCITV